MTDTTTINHEVLDNLIAHLKRDEMHNEVRGYWKYTEDGLTILGQAKYEYTDTAFNLAAWKHPCGAPACIAGHVVYRDLAKRCKTQSEARELYDLVTTDDHFHFQEVAGELLGIDYREADRLFVPIMSHIDAVWKLLDDETMGSFGNNEMRECIPVSAAIKVLEHLKETGEVNWDIAGDEIAEAIKKRFKRKAHVTE